MVNTVRKIAATNLIADPVFFFPTFYTFKEAMEDRAVGLVQVKNALGKYSSNMRDDILTSWAIWVPGHTITYGFMPIHLRMPWIAAVSFVYVSVLSFMRGELHEMDESTRKTADGKLSRRLTSVGLAGEMAKK